MMTDDEYDDDDSIVFSLHSSYRYIYIIDIDMVTQPYRYVVRMAIVHSS